LLLTRPQFQNGKFHGKGVYYFKNSGKTVEAYFENGKPVKKPPK
jgi:hypothetical protein